MMNRKLAIVLGLIFAILAGVAYYIYVIEYPQQDTSHPQKVVKPKTLKDVVESSRAKTEKSISKEEAVNKLYHQMLESGKKRHRPIDFYGMVVDQHNNPVPDFPLNVGISKFSALHLGLKRKVMNIKTDPQGRFSILGEKGFTLIVLQQNVNDYIVNQQIFSYRNQAGITPPDTSMENPHSIRVYKREPQFEEELIVKKFHFKLTPGDRVHTLDLVNSRQYAGRQSGDLWVVISRDSDAEQYGKYNWKVQFEVPDGGLIPTSDKMLYYAPNSGYIKSWAYSITKKQKGWTNVKIQKFYLKSRGGHVYARLESYISPYFGYDGKAYIKLKYWLNKNGSKNLYSLKVP